MPDATQWTVFTQSVEHATAGALSCEARVSCDLQPPAESVPAGLTSENLASGLKCAVAGLILQCLSHQNLITVFSSFPNITFT